MRPVDHPGIGVGHKMEVHGVHLIYLHHLQPASEAVSRPESRLVQRLHFLIQEAASIHILGEVPSSARLPRGNAHVWVQSTRSPVSLF